MTDTATKLDRDRLRDITNLLSLYANDACIFRAMPELRKTSQEGFDRNLRLLVAEYGFRLVPANDKELEDA
jgi:hypothetical protein